jgi:hypothetical protein
VFFDSGQPGVALAELMPALKEAKSPLDLLQSNESYDRTQSLVGTGAPTPFVGIALASMAGYANSDTRAPSGARAGDWVAPGCCDNGEDTAADTTTLDGLKRHRVQLGQIDPARQPVVWPMPVTLAAVHQRVKADTSPRRVGRRTSQ